MSSNGISTERKRLTTSRNRHITGHARLVIALGLTMAMIATVASSPAAAGPTWIGPESLSGTESETVESPQIGLDAAGNATVIWQAEKTGSVRRAKYTDRSIGGEWNAPEYLVSEDQSLLGDYVVNPDLAVDAEGNAVALWLSDSGPFSRVVETHRDVGGEWSELALLSKVRDIEDTNKLNPRITVAGGNAVATWRRMRPADDPLGGSEIWARIRADGESWGDARELSGSLTASDQQAVVNDAGDAVVVWVRYKDADATVRVSTYSTDRGWSRFDVSLSPNAGVMAYAPDVTIDEAGNAVVVWKQFDPTDGSWHIKSSYRPAGADAGYPSGGWGEPVDILSGGLSVRDLKIEVEGDGNAVAVWSQLDGGSLKNRNTYAVTRKDDEEWGEPTVVAIVDRNDVSPSPQLAVNAAGDAMVVWVGQDDLDSSSGIYSATRSADSDPDDGRGGWAKPDVVTAGMLSNPGVPGVAIDADGNSVTTWTDSTGEPVVRAAAYDATAPRLVGLNIPATGTVGVPISFSVSSFDAWSGIGGTTWSFGDGQQVTGASVSHSYTSPGTYQVQAKAADLVGNVSTETRTITISPGAQDPDTGPPATQPSDLSNPSVTTPQAKLQSVSLSDVSLQIKCLKRVRAGSKKNRTTKRKKTGRLARCGQRSKLPRRLVVRFKSSAAVKVKLRVSRRVKKRIRGKKSRFVIRTVLKRTLTAKKGKNSFVLAIKRRHARGRLSGKVYVKGARSSRMNRVRR